MPKGMVDIFKADHDRAEYSKQSTDWTERFFNACKDFSGNLKKTDFPSGTLVANVTEPLV
jgi:hypothetical protein